jgi:hypothetical protein
MEELEESFTFSRMGFGEEEIRNACQITGTQLVRIEGTIAVMLGTTREMLRFDRTLQKLVAARELANAMLDVSCRLEEIEAAGGLEAANRDRPDLVQNAGRAIRRRDAAAANVNRLEAEALRMGALKS